MTPAAYQASWSPDEKTFQRCVVEAAQRLGWLTVHFRQMVGNPAGWPDLIMIKGGRVLFVELKRERGKISPKQAEWIERLSSVGADVRVWYPSMWDSILAILSGETAKGQAA